MRHHLDQPRTGGLPARRFANRYRHRDGSWRWLAWVGVPDDGKVYCSARDITADKEQASALAQAEEALRQPQKMEAAGQLTGGVAHDFNLPTVIRSSTALLKRPTPSKERRVRYVGAISDTAAWSTMSLRDRVATIGAGLSRRKAAERSGVSVASAIRWARLSRPAGHVRPDPALEADANTVANQPHADHQLGIDRRPARWSMGQAASLDLPRTHHLR